MERRAALMRRLQRHSPSGCWGEVGMALKKRARLKRGLRSRGRTPALALTLIFLFSGNGMAAEAPPPEEEMPSEPAEEEPPPLAHDFNTYMPTARATKIDATEAPTIDGDLSDPAWAKAQVIDDFYQLDPDPGQPPSETTVLRFFYDKKNLYVGIYPYEKEREKIAPTNRPREGTPTANDTVPLIPDPKNPRRNS